MKLFSVFLLSVFCMYGVFAQDVMDSKEVSKIEVIIPGVLQDDSPEINIGDTWWGLRETEVMAYELVQTTVTLNTLNHWKEKRDVVEIVPGVEGRWLFLIKGSPLLTEGHIETDYEFCGKKLYPGQEMSTRNFKRGDYKNRYSIFAMGNVKNKRIAEDYSINICSVSNPGDSFQTIMRFQEVDVEYGDIPYFLWVGDIDRDLVPDIFVRNRSGYEGVFTLFLSSEAEEGEIVHKVAEIQKE